MEDGQRRANQSWVSVGEMGVSWKTIVWCTGGAETAEDCSNRDSLEALIL